MRMSRQTVKPLVNILLDKGDRDIGLIGWEQGDATWLGRWEGYKAGVDKWNEAHPDDPAHFLSRSTQVQLPKVVPRQQRLLWQQIRTWMHSSRQAAAVTLFRCNRSSRACRQDPGYRYRIYRFPSGSWRQTGERLHGW